MSKKRYSDLTDDSSDSQEGQVQEVPKINPQMTIN